MKFDQLPSDLRNWFRDMIGRRTSRDDLLRALLAAGYQKRMAEDAVTAAVSAIPAPAPAPEPAPVRRARRFGSRRRRPARPRDARSFSEQLAQIAQRVRDVRPGSVDAVRARGAARDPVRQPPGSGGVRPAHRTVARQAGAVERGERRHRQLRRAPASHERGNALRARRERADPAHRGAHRGSRARFPSSAASRCRSCTTSRAASTSRTSTTSIRRSRATRPC